MLIVAKVAAIAACLLVGVQSGTIALKQAAQVQPKLSLGQPVQVGTLAIVPIESTLPIAQDKYLTLAQATKLGVVEIVETPGQEQVNSLEVRNRSEMPILLFAGELLLGGKQDRIVAKDSIVPAKERRDVPVFCVEHGRWNGTPEFRGGNGLVIDQVRNVALSSQSQTAVWDKVAKTNLQTGVAPMTGTIRGTLDDPKIKQRADQLFEEVRTRFRSDRKTVGTMCWIDGKIESADIFANNQLFEGGRDSLFKSYALDVQLVQNPRTVPVSMKACEAFLQSIVAARRNEGAADAYGRSYVIQNRDVSGYESGNGLFRGSAGGAMGGGGFGHGTYKPGQPGKPGG